LGCGLNDNCPIGPGFWCKNAPYKPEGFMCLCRMGKFAACQYL